MATRSNYFARQWRGLNGLGYAYWINGVLLGSVIYGLFYAADYLLGIDVDRMTAEGANTSARHAATVLWLGVARTFLAAPLFVALGLWQVVGVARSGARGVRSGRSRFWPVIAFILIVLGAGACAWDAVSDAVTVVQNWALIRLGFAFMSVPP